MTVKTKLQIPVTNIVNSLIFDSGPWMTAERESSDSRRCSAVCLLEEKYPSTEQDFL